MNVRRILHGMARQAVRCVPRGGLDRLDRLLHANAPRHFSQEGEDIILQRLFEGKTDGHYVDVGAHHPSRFSNTCLFHQIGWSGINIEPNPDAVRLFRDERYRDINLQVGVSDVAGTLTYIVFDEPALNTFDVDLATEREATTRYRIIDRIEVRVERLADLLAAHLPPGWKIDFMSVDVEGFDLRVVQSNDWTRFRPRYLLVECLKASIATVEKEPMHRLLVAQGYALYAKTVNTFIYRDEAESP